MDYIKVLLIMLGFVAILYAAYVTTRLIGNKYGKTGHSRYIKVIDQLILAKDKWIYMVQIGERFFIIGVTNNSIVTLGEIEHKDLIPVDNGQENNFSDFFSKYLKTPYFKKDSGEGENDKNTKTL